MSFPFYSQHNVIPDYYKLTKAAIFTSNAHWHSLIFFMNLWNYWVFSGSAKNSTAIEDIIGLIMTLLTLKCSITQTFYITFNGIDLTHFFHACLTFIGSYSNVMSVYYRFFPLLAAMQTDSFRHWKKKTWMNRLMLRRKLLMRRWHISYTSSSHVTLTFPSVDLLPRTV